MLLRKTLQDGEEEVCFLSILTLTHLVRYCRNKDKKVQMLKHNIIIGGITKVQIYLYLNDVFAKVNIFCFY